MKFRIPISFKLIVITLSLVLGAVLPVNIMSTEQFEKSSTERVQANNRDQARLRATDVEGLFIGYVDKVKMISALIMNPDRDPVESEKALDLTFRRDRDLVSIEVVRANQGQEAPNRIVNDEYLKQYKANKNYISELRKYQEKNRRFQKSAVFAGQVEIRNSSIEGGPPLITIGVPIAKDDFGDVTHIAIGEVRLDRLQKAFANKGAIVSYLVDKEGLLVAHPEEQKVFRSESVAAVPIVGAALNSQLKEGQKRYESIDKGDVFTGAYARTPLGLTVIVEASEEVILEDARQIRRKSLFIVGQSIAVALFLTFIFSITLTSPIEKLAEVTAEVAQGNFDVKSNIKSRDEVGDLGRSFDSMIEGLQERDKMKNVLNKFHGSAVADNLVGGELELGGSRKTVTVFFSDIRDFTKFSEGHTAEEVVEMLNEYFQVMVAIINKNNGVVDKFIGDAIMAVWGAPQAADRDAFDAVKACVEMREALGELNKIRIERDQVPIKIGMGLHSGEAISGTIGSDERMEYTVIGDTVNQSARIEASTKAFGADLLLSQETTDLVKAEFMIEKAGDVEVKGKSNALSLYKVRGYIDADGNEIRVQTEWSDYAAGKADKVKMAS